MDGVHDLGGVEGFGRVDEEADEPVFHHDWERRALGLTMGTFVTGLSNGAEFRHSIERMDPVHYLTSRYYEHWVTGVATRMVERGWATVGDLERRAGGSFPLSRPVAAALAPAPEQPATSPRFAVGARVRGRDVTTRGHTRCPRYVRHRVGTVARVDPPLSLPDVEAHSGNRVVEPVYSVRFEMRELWGTDDGATVNVDLWESYLEAV